MSVARVSVYVREDAPLDAHVHLSGAAEPSAWLYVDEEQDVAVWGSPAALRRLAAALVVVAEEADALLAPSEVTVRLRDALDERACEAVAAS